jgi:hypothetical protein
MRALFHLPLRGVVRAERERWGWRVRAPKDWSSASLTIHFGRASARRPTRLIPLRPQDDLPQGEVNRDLRLCVLAEALPQGR